VSGYIGRFGLSDPFRVRWPSKRI